MIEGEQGSPIAQATKNIEQHAVKNATPIPHLVHVLLQEGGVAVKTQEGGLDEKQKLETTLATAKALLEKQLGTKAVAGSLSLSHLTSKRQESLADVILAQNKTEKGLITPDQAKLNVDFLMQNTEFDESVFTLAGLSKLNHLLNQSVQDSLQSNPHSQLQTINEMGGASYESKLVKPMEDILVKINILLEQGNFAENDQLQIKLMAWQDILQNRVYNNLVGEDTVKQRLETARTQFDDQDKAKKERFADKFNRMRRGEIKPGSTETTLDDMKDSIAQFAPDTDTAAMPEAAIRAKYQEIRQERVEKKLLGLAREEKGEDLAKKMERQLLETGSLININEVIAKLKEKGIDISVIRQTIGQELDNVKKGKSPETALFPHIASLTNMIKETFPHDTAFFMSAMLARSEAVCVGKAHLSSYLLRLCGLDATNCLVLNGMDINPGQPNRITERHGIFQVRLPSGKILCMDENFPPVEKNTDGFDHLAYVLTPKPAYHWSKAIHSLHSMTFEERKDYFFEALNDKNHVVIVNDDVVGEYECSSPQHHKYLASDPHPSVLDSGSLTNMGILYLTAYQQEKDPQKKQQYLEGTQSFFAQSLKENPQNSIAYQLLAELNFSQAAAVRQNSTEWHMLVDQARKNYKKAYAINPYAYMIDQGFKREIDEEELRRK